MTPNDYYTIGKILAGFAIGLIIIGAFLNRYGLLHFGRAKCPANGNKRDFISTHACPDPSCQNAIIYRLSSLEQQTAVMDERQIEIKGQQEKQWDKLEEVLGKVNWIKGYLEKNPAPK